MASDPLPPRSTSLLDFCCPRSKVSDEFAVLVDGRELEGKSALGSFPPYGTPYGGMNTVVDDAVLPTDAPVLSWGVAAPSEGVGGVTVG